MENQRENRSYNGYKGKRAEGGYRSEGGSRTGQDGRRSSYGSGSGGGYRGNSKPKGPYVPRDKDGGAQSGGDRPYQKKDFQRKPYPQGGRSQGYQGRPQGGGYYKDKDEDYDNAGKREQKKLVAPSRDKGKELQPDKSDIALRLEKEKKAMQKKKQESKRGNQSPKPQKRVKRSNNIDWTREYENDSYDDDDMSYFY